MGNQQVICLYLCLFLIPYPLTVVSSRQLSSRAIISSEIYFPIKNPDIMTSLILVHICYKFLDLIKLRFAWLHFCILYFLLRRFAFCVLRFFFSFFPIIPAYIIILLFAFLIFLGGFWLLLLCVFFVLLKVVKLFILRYYFRFSVIIFLQ